MTTLHLDKTNFNTEKIKNKFKRITNIKKNITCNSSRSYFI